jgi:hypothetical protein
VALDQELLNDIAQIVHFDSLRHCLIGRATTELSPSARHSRRRGPARPGPDGYRYDPDVDVLDLGPKVLRLLEKRHEDDDRWRHSLMTLATIRSRRRRPKRLPLVSMERPAHLRCTRG